MAVNPSTPPGRGLATIHRLRPELTFVLDFEESSPRLQPVIPGRCLTYPAYYPTIALDPFLRIVSSNAACRALVGRPVFNMHLIHLFHFTPQVWLSLDDTDSRNPLLRAVGYFDLYTQAYRDPQHHLHAAYVGVIDQLREHIPNLAVLQEQAQALHLTRAYADHERRLRTAGTLSLLYQQLDGAQRSLEVEAIVPEVDDIVPAEPGHAYFYLTLVPTNPETEAVLILLALREATRATDLAPSLPAAWREGAWRAVLAGLRLAGSDPLWRPEASFAQLAHQRTHRALDRSQHLQLVQEALQHWVARRGAQSAASGTTLDRQSIVDIIDYFTYYQATEMSTIHETPSQDVPLPRREDAPSIGERRGGSEMELTAQRDAAAVPSRESDTVEQRAIPVQMTSGISYDVDEMETRLDAIYQSESDLIKQVFAEHAQASRQVMAHARRGVPDYSDLFVEQTRWVGEHVVGPRQRAKHP